MPADRSSALLVVGFVAGVGLAVWLLAALPPAAPTATAQPAPTPAAPKREEPPYRGLDANLYIQTAAEYHACCLQAFRWADVRLAEKLAARNPAGKPPAVVLDLDETVLDNAAFQTRQIRAGLAFDQKVWDAYEETGGEAVGLVPGAKAFLDRARERKVAVVYITNRGEKFRERTRAVLTRLGVAVPDDRLLLATKTSDKTERRKAAADQFDVLLLVGDNLRDFDDKFKYDPAAGVGGRKRAVDADANHFGDDWIILPNPAYGEWTKPLGKGVKDADLLGPKAP